MSNNLQGAKWIDDMISHGSQSWTRSVTISSDGHKIRAIVERDLYYDKQSRIFVEVFSGATLSWNRVQSRSGLDYSDLPSSSSKNDTVITAESDDLIGSLLEYAIEILDGVKA